MIPNNFFVWTFTHLYSWIQGLGRTACIGTILGIVGGIHLAIWIQLLFFFCFGGTISLSHQHNQLPNATVPTILNSNNNHIIHTQQQNILFMLFQWCTYIIGLCTFHLLEFFITAIYNPTQTTSDSYLINHSITYTTAAITSWMEFWIRFFVIVVCTVRRVPIFDTISIPYTISYYIGLVVLIIAQCIRSMAMATAGESFNHLIQTSKKQNHVLITHGIYRVFRHPSYVGFFYWSISTQLVLGNVIHVVLYTIAAWTFFHRRIRYEEESLYQFFPESYPRYVTQTYMGIPGIQSQSLDRTCNSTTTTPKYMTLSSSTNDDTTTHNTNPKEKGT